MQKEALQRLREPIGWVLVAAAGLQLLAGIVLLFSDSLDAGGKFTIRALAETIGGRDLVTGMTLTALLVIAVLVTTSGPAPARQARNIATAALGVFCAALLFGVITWLAGLAAGAEGIEIGAGVKFAAFLYGAAKLAVLGIGAFYVYNVFQGLQPPRPAAHQQGAGFQGYGGYQEGQQQYPQQGGGYQQPVEGQQYDPQQYQQYPQQEGYQQQGYQQQGYQQGGYQQGQPQQGYSQQGGQSLEDESAGEWTRAYGGDQPQPGGYGQSGYGQPEQRREEGGEWYRDGRPPQ